MTDSLREHADPELHKGEALVEMVDVGKTYGAIRALKGINMTVKAGEVTGVLGDNGAGKSTLIKIIAGLHPHNEGTMLVDGVETTFSSPREALERGIATVYQDLAVVGLMEVWRNFFLGSELVASGFPLAPLRVRDMKRIADEELRKMGIVVKDIDQPIGTLSGGQRQCVAIARAVYFGARVLILDEPTAALGVKQSGVVLKYTAEVPPVPRTLGVEGQPGRSDPVERVSNSIGDSIPILECRRLRLYHDSIHRNIALASSSRVNHTCESSSSSCILSQKDSIIALS
ncbi:sugar ABC transporter ATP-binding protein [Microlunatus phosphovorus NM-1]|uniref:Sugar ABC transporter ATP-binding protein n=1 Tax=Microlunatus phosphovorus (strain ATCC 700054 / DSM 10555 / JCM 9379 / NBRC 101784 / NCIMB 13414 / VKM Ac-1990 / NM-1) TaxID=1032480 RepID=F5XFH5_MICPN|nr:sugar ABC transporter ATP-binding protein [Microlunatus phosphovorus NM-1]